MKNEHIEFLARLKDELLHQPTDGNCDPRFWGIIEEKKDYGYEEEYAEGWEVYDGENACTIEGADSVQSVIDAVISDYEFTLDDFEECDCSDITEVVDTVNSVLAQKQGYGSSYAPYSVAYYRKTTSVSQDALFLTKKACLEHIERYGYNYNNPHTYVMTANRCPEYETLLKIIKEIDWDSEERCIQSLQDDNAAMREEWQEMSNELHRMREHLTAKDAELAKRNADIRSAELSKRGYQEVIADLEDEIKSVIILRDSMYAEKDKEFAAAQRRADAAVKDMHGYCKACANMPKSLDYEELANPTCRECSKVIKQNWKWRGVAEKEENNG